MLIAFSASAQYSESVREAVEEAFSLAEKTPDSVIVACGTLSFAGDIIREVKSFKRGTC